MWIVISTCDSHRYFVLASLFGKGRWAGLDFGVENQNGRRCKFGASACLGLATPTKAACAASFRYFRFWKLASRAAALTTARFGSGFGSSSKAFAHFGSSALCPCMCTTRCRKSPKTQEHCLEPPRGGRTPAHMQCLSCLRFLGLLACQCHCSSKEQVLRPHGTSRICR